MLFSQRYHRALEQQTLKVELLEDIRRKLWSWLSANNTSLRLQRDPNDNWISNSSILEEAEAKMLVEHGWDELPSTSLIEANSAFHEFFLNGDAPFVFDVVELVGNWMRPEERETTRQKVNQIFAQHSCPWRLTDGEFFKLDQDFIGVQLSLSAHDALTTNGFTGAAQEYSKARQYAGSGDIREAINFAGHSFESVMKVLTGRDHVNADRLIKELAEKGYFDDLPQAVRAGFADQVLKALPFLRNKLGGHGQGAVVIDIPSVYGELAIQLAATFHNFLIAKHLQRCPPPQSACDDEIPF